MPSPDRQARSIASYLIPSLADVLFICVLLTMSLIPDKGLLNDGDTGYHIRAGELMLDTFTLLRLDPYSFITPQLPWTAHEWLAEIFMAIAHRLAGLSGVVVFYALLLAVTYYTIVKVLKAQGHNALTAVTATIVILSASTVHWLARPHIFSLLFIILWCHLLECYESRGKDRLYLLPLLMLGWVNLHGGYIIGFVLTGIYLAGNLLLRFTDTSEWHSGGRERSRRYATILGLSAGTALFNPFGWKIFLFPFKLVFDRYLMDHVMEFLSPNFHEQPLFKCMLLVVILILALSRKRVTVIHLTLILFFTNMALTSVRYIPLFAMIVVPIILRYLNVDLGDNVSGVRQFLRKRITVISSMDGNARGFFWPLAVVVVVLVQLWSGTIVHGFDPKKKPVAAIEFLKKEHVSGRMFNNDEFGDVLIYMAHKEYKVFFDGRSDMYGSEIMKKYYSVIAFSPGWEKILDSYGIDWVFFDTDSVLVRHLTSRPDWKLIYSDQVASILVKNIPVYAALIARHPDVQLAKIEKKKGEKQE